MDTVTEADMAIAMAVSWARGWGPEELSRVGRTSGGTAVRGGVGRVRTTGP